MNNQITVTQQSQFSAKHAEQFRAIYLDSFPPHERADFSCLIESIANGNRWFFAATCENNLLGLAIIVPCVASDFHLLEYLAVSKDVRNDGIGGIILSSVVAAMCAIGNASGLLIEVESDDEGDLPERRLRARRIQFYQRHGARLVDCAPEYRVPLTDREGMMPMKLLWLAICENAKTPHGEKLRECIRGVFVKSYRLGSDSLLFQSVIEDLIC